MDNIGPKETAIVAEVAKIAARRIVRQVIWSLQQMEYTLSGDDSVLKTTWDEICVQEQSQRSFAWEVYDQTVRATIGGYVCELPAHEREAIWLQTEAGIDWDLEGPENRKGCPVTDDDIVKYLATQYVYPKAERWSNARIRVFIERSSMRD